MKITCRLVGSDEDASVEPDDVRVVPLADLDVSLGRGAIFLMKECRFVPVQQRYVDEYYMLVAALGGFELTWTSLTGYHAGAQTLLSFAPDEGTSKIGARRLLTLLAQTYGAMPGHRFDRRAVYYVDGALEMTRS